MLLSAGPAEAALPRVGVLLRRVPPLQPRAAPSLLLGARRHWQRRAPAAPLPAAAASGGPRGTGPSEMDMYAVVPTSPAAAAPPKPATTKVPFYVYVPLGFAALVAVMRVVGAVMRKGRKGSISDDYRRDVADDQHYERMMRNMRTTQYEELTEEQILAARARRMREIARDTAPMDLDKIELPDNHPFAVKRKLSPEEEAQQAQRLRARRGLSEEDLRMLEAARRQSLAEE